MGNFQKSGLRDLKTITEFCGIQFPVSQANRKWPALRECFFVRALWRQEEVSPSLSTRVQSKLLSSFWLPETISSPSILYSFGLDP